MNKTTGHTDIQWSLNESQEVVWDDPGERMKLGMTESSKNITIIALCSDAAASEGGQGLSYQYSLVPFFRHDVCNILTINFMQSCMDTAAVQGEDDELDNWNHSKFKNHGLVDGTPTDIWEYKPKYVGSAENDAAGKCRPPDSTTYVYEIATGTNHMLRFGQYKWTCEVKGWQNDTTTFSNYRAGVTDADFAPNMPCKNLTDNLGYGNSSFRTQLLPSQVRQRAHRADKARRSRARKEGRLQAGQDLLVNDDVEIEQLQRVLEGAGSPWTAGRNERFDGVRQKELFGMLGTHVLPATLPGAGIGGLAKVAGTAAAQTAAALPASFSALDKWPKCIHPIRDQSACGSCWAFGATESFTDRVCIETGGNTDVLLAPETLVDCDKSDQGCLGGFVDNAWVFINRTGLLTEACDPYMNYDSKCPLDEGKCPGTGAGATLQLYKASEVYPVAATVEAIQTEIFNHGPVEGAFFVMSDFMKYKSGTYQRTNSSEFQGGHAIKIVGWGVDANGTEFWTVGATMCHTESAWTLAIPAWIHVSLCVCLCVCVCVVCGCPRSRTRGG